jgi:hypothetical protein
VTPDTDGNGARYPRPGAQADGVGFPLARAVMVIRLAAGAARGAVIGAHSGKDTGELSLRRGLAGGAGPAKMSSRNSMRVAGTSNWICATSRPRWAWRRSTAVPPR